MYESILRKFRKNGVRRIRTAVMRTRDSLQAVSSERILVSTKINNMTSSKSNFGV